MRRLGLLCFFALLLACNRTKKAVPEPTASDAGMTTPVTTVVEAGPAPITKPPVSRDLELVAVGKSSDATIIWLKILGDRVWLSGKNLDAYSTGDGPLARGPDMLKGLPYQGGVHHLDVVGDEERIFAVRYRDVQGRGDHNDATVFVRHGDAWTQAKPLKDLDRPHALVRWGDGVLLVWSTAAFPYPTTWDGKKGTRFAYVAPDGAVDEKPALPLEDNVIAWAADSDGKTLSLLGMRGIKGTQAHEIVLARGTALGFTTTMLINFVVPSMNAGTSHVRETGSSAVVIPPFGNAVPNEWRPDSRTIRVVSRAGIEKRLARDDGDVRDAVFLGSTLYVASLLRPLQTIEADAKPTRVELAIAPKEGGGYRKAKPTDEKSIPCTVDTLHKRAEDDLWVVARCATPDPAGPTIPAVFRTGRPQEPIVWP